MVLKALTDKRKILVIRKVGATLKDSVWQLTLDTLSAFGLLDHVKTNKTDFHIVLPNGSMFLFKSLDDPEKIKSITGITDIWIEEATELTLDDFSQLNLRLRDPRAKGQEIILSFNPISKANWVYKYFFEDGVPDNCEVLHTNYQHNRFLPKEYVDSLLSLKEKNETYYKIYALGQFGNLNKLVFENWKVQDFDTRNFTNNLMYGMDFGFINDPTAIICSYLDNRTNTIYIYKEEVRKGLINSEIYELLVEMNIELETIIADSAEQKSIEEIRRYGARRIRPAKKGPGSVNQGISQLQSYRIIIHPDCKNTIEEFQNYSYKRDKKTGEYINEPEDMYNHTIDALRYSLQCLETGKLQSLDLKTLKLGI